MPIFYILIFFCSRDLLGPAVPGSVDKLPAYQDLVDKTEVLNDYLVNNNFLAASNMTLLNYARNVDALFANKVCQVRSSLIYAYSFFYPFLMCIRILIFRMYRFMNTFFRTFLHGPETS